MKRLSLVLLCLIAVGCKEQQGQTVDGADIVRSQVPRCQQNQYLSSNSDGSMKCNDLPAGIVGQPGQDGQNGQDGFSLVSGQSDPTSPQGKVGDTYIQMVTGDVFYKDENGWNKTGNIKGAKGDQGEAGIRGNDGSAGEKGDTGDRGADGLSIYSDNIDPVSAAGKSGDTFINSTSGDVFLKVGSTWEQRGNIKGPRGADGIAGAKGDKGDTGEKGDAGQNGTDGASLLVGNSDPTSETGKDGDSYFDAFGNVWSRINGAWSLIKNLVGAKGDSGERGTDGIAGAKGDKGDTGERGADGVAGVKGDKGEAGERGADGAAGAKGDKGDVGERGNGILVGTSDPVTEGKDGDSFINKVTADLWNRVNGAWEKVVSLIGPKGDAGERGTDGAIGAKGDTGERGADGIAGEKGDKGDSGAPCTTEQVENGLKVTCGDGTTAIVYSSDNSVKSFARSDLPVCGPSEVLAAANGALSCKSIPADESKLPLDGGVMNGSIDMGSVPGTVDNRVRNMADPELPQDSATKAYVDSKVSSINVTSGVTINVNNTVGSTSYYLTVINNLRNQVLVGDIKIKFAAGTYVVPALTTGGINGLGLYFNHSFANKITLEGDTSNAENVKLVAATNSQPVLTIAASTRISRIDSITFESAPGGATSGVIRLLQQSGVTLSRVNIVTNATGASNTGALRLEDGADVVFMNNNYINGNGAAMSRGLHCNGQSRVIFSLPSAGTLTISNFGATTAAAIDALSGCRVIGNSALSINIGAGMTTKPALNTTSNEAGYAGSYIGY